MYIVLVTAGVFDLAMTLIALVIALGVMLVLGKMKSRKKKE